MARTSFAYNANGVLETLTLPTAFGATLTYGYDTAGRPTTRSVATGQATLHTRAYEAASGRIDELAPVWWTPKDWDHRSQGRESTCRTRIPRTPRSSGLRR